MATHSATPHEEQKHSAASLWLVMMKSYRSMQLYVEQTLASRSICLSDFMILEALLHKGAMNMSLLGEAVVLAKPSMTAAIARLEELGYVQRESDSEDRRVRSVALTTHGQHFIQQLFEQHQCDLERVMADLTPQKRESTRAALKGIGLAARKQLEQALQHGCRPNTARVSQQP